MVLVLYGLNVILKGWYFGKKEFKMYKILNIYLDIKNINLPSCWKKFAATNDIKTSDLEIKQLDRSMDKYGIEQYDLANQENHIVRYGSEVMIISHDWQQVKILPMNEYDRLQTLIIQSFYVHAIRNRAIQIHSSLIKYQDMGIMFLGPSGIGKTTQAELWNKYLDAIIINGDMVYVQENENNFLGWGTPWHGSSSYCENTNVLIKALIVLKQGNENQIRKLSGYEILKEVGQNIIYPLWLENGVELCLDILDQLLMNIPVYELTNKADLESVELVKNIVLKM